MWLTVNTHSVDIYVGPISRGDEPIDWPDDMTLDQLLSGQFRSYSQISVQREPARLDPAFTAAYLVNICNVRLHWTDDMAAHLRFDPTRKVLTIYRHKACLIAHLEKREGCPIPAEVPEEILDTMDLLFPPWDSATQQLLRKEKQQSISTLGCRTSVRNLDLAYYKCFRDRLEELAESFEKLRTWKQLAFDRRNKLEWAAFWVTMMVGLLTVISIPCNIIQATYSVKAYHVALAQGNNAGR